MAGLVETFAKGRHTLHALVWSLAAVVTSSLKPPCKKVFTSADLVLNNATVGEVWGFLGIRHHLSGRPHFKDLCDKLSIGMSDASLLTLRHKTYNSLGLCRGLLADVLYFFADDVSGVIYSYDLRDHVTSF